jgi:hypothetical protein
MSLKHVGLTVATFALFAAVNAAPAAAQVPNCGDMYNRVMQLYQAAPASPEYAQMASAYSASCVGPSASAGPAYPAATYSTPTYGYAPAYVYGAPVSVGVGVGYGGGYYGGGYGGGWRR